MRQRGAPPGRHRRPRAAGAKPAGRGAGAGRRLRLPGAAAGPDGDGTQLGARHAGRVAPGQRRSVTLAQNYIIYTLL